MTPYRDDAFRKRTGDLLRRMKILRADRELTIARLAKRLEANPASDTIANRLKALLDAYEEWSLRHPIHLPPPPTEEDLYPDGRPPDFVIGEVIESEGLLYGPRFSGEAGTTVITGIPGGGKTTLVHRLIDGVLSSMPEVSILILDPRLDSTCLLGIGRRVSVVKTSEIRFNLLRPPPGVELHQWLRTLAHDLCESRGLKKSRHVLLDAMLGACHEFGVDQDPDRPWPSLADVLRYVERNYRRRFKQEYVASLITELQGLLDETGTLFDTSGGASLMGELLIPGTAFALQTDPLPPAAQRFLASVLVDHVFACQMARNVHNLGLRYLVVLDEAQVILPESADRASDDSVAPLSHLLLRARETGIGFIIVAHELCRISPAVLAASRLRVVVGNLGHTNDMVMAVRMMNLPLETMEMFGALGRGEAIVQELGRDFGSPFLVAIKPPIIAKDVIDEDTRQRMMKPFLDTLDQTPSLPLPSRSKSAAAPDPNALTPLQMRLLMDCCSHFYSGTNARAERLALADYKTLKEAIAGLAKMKLIKPLLLQIGSRRFEIIEVLPEGWAKTHQKRPTDYTGRGGLQHRTLIEWARKRLQSLGWRELIIENVIGPNRHPADLTGISPAGLFVAFEVCYSTTRNVCDHARNSFGPGGAQELHFLSCTQADCDKTRRLLDGDPTLTAILPHIRVVRLDRFLF